MKADIVSEMMSALLGRQNLDVVGARTGKQLDQLMEEDRSNEVTSDSNERAM